MDSIFCHGAITASARAEWAQLDDLGPAFGAWISLSGSGSSSGRRGEWKFPGECTLCSSAAIRMSVPILEAHHPALFVCDGALARWCCGQEGRWEDRLGEEGGGIGPGR